MLKITIKVDTKTELNDADEPSPLPMGIYEEVYTRNARLLSRFLNF